MLTKKAMLIGLAMVCLAATQPPVPEPLQAPAGEHLLVHAQGRGFQVYVGQSDHSWKLQGPEAELFDEQGGRVGRHFAGPSWEWQDHSRVSGKVLASVPAPADNCIPWLLLTVTKHEGSGVLSGVSSIQRLNASGGKAPALAVEEGREERVPYTAEYYFYGP